MVNSNDKGKRGERELSRELERLLGCSARRGRQYSGSPDSPDIVTDIKGLHIECKYVERLNVDNAMEQAEQDAGQSQVPVVCHRRSKKRWKVTLYLDDLVNLSEIIMHCRQKNV